MNGKNLNEEILLSVPQAARLIHTDVNRVRSFIKAGKIKALKLGELKIRRAEIDRFLAEAEGFDYTDVSNIRKLEI